VGVGAIQLGTSELRSSAWMVRLTPSGAQRWSIALSGPGDTVLDDVTVADGGDVIAVGWAGSSKGLDALAARVDAQGRVAWQIAMGAKDDESAEAVTRLAAGDYALVGNTAVFTTVPNCRPFLARFDGSGTVAWQKTVDAPAETCVAVTDMAPSSTGGFAWAGFDTSPFEQGTIQAVLLLRGIVHHPLDSSFEQEVSEQRQHNHDGAVGKNDPPAHRTIRNVTCAKATPG